MSQVWRKIKRYFSLRELKRVGLWKTFRRLLVGGTVVLALLFVWYSKDLPTPARINKRINVPSSQILDRNGDLLFAVSQNKKRLVVPLDEIPDSVKQATIAVEDQNFYKHFGVDFKGILRSAFIDVTRGGAKQGGSTITQQFVKNALLTSKKSFSRKIKELILSLELEAIYSKDKILEFYLNEIPYGSTAYGVEAASRTYFGKPAKELALQESAVLAALPQAPSYYSPYGPHKAELLKRKDFVLEKMAKLGFISDQELKEAKKAEIKFQPRKDSIAAPHFVFYIQDLVSQKYGEEALQNGGLKITTTLDLKVQKMAEEAIEEGSKKLDRYDANNAALVAVDPKTGQILAMVGSRDYFNEEIQGQVNVTTAKRQPGSSFKPIVYATAFKGKYNPAYPLFDLITDFGGGYTPQNYDGNTRGPVSMRTALSNSLNIPAVKTLGLVGVNAAIETARELGITTLTDPDRYGLALVLGGGEVKPLEMAGAFGVFGNEGKFNPSTGILKIETKDGKLLEEFKDPPQKQVLDPQIAYLISHVLSDNEARKMIFGFTNNLTIPGRQAAVKTGTTQENHDGWTVGYTPQISTAVWAGNTNNKEMKKGADGSVIAAPIWNIFMRKFLADKPAEDFIRPEGIQEITVDFLSNKLLENDSPPQDNRKDLFASWQVPSEKDDIHVKVKINKLNGKLASDQTPPELVEERLFTNVHSEKPDKPNWENPVRAWAQVSGMDNLPPTEKDDSYSLEKRPAITITSPANNANIEGKLVVQAEASGSYGIKQVSFAVDNSVVEEDTAPPYSLTKPASELTAGSHTISAIALDSNGASASASINIVVVAISDTSPPIVSGVTVSTTAGAAIFSFTTSEAAVSFIEYGTTPTLGASSVSESNYSSAHTISIGGLTPKTLYYYLINGKDKSANSSKSATATFMTK